MDIAEYEEQEEHRAHRKDYGYWKGNTRSPGFGCVRPRAGSP